MTLLFLFLFQITRVQEDVLSELLGEQNSHTQRAFFRTADILAEPEIGIDLDIERMADLVKMWFSNRTTNHLIKKKIVKTTTGGRVERQARRGRGGREEAEGGGEGEEEERQQKQEEEQQQEQGERGGGGGFHGGSRVLNVLSLRETTCFINEDLTFTLTSFCGKTCRKRFFIT